MTFTLAVVMVGHGAALGAQVALTLAGVLAVAGLAVVPRRVWAGLLTALGLAAVLVATEVAVYYPCDGWLDCILKSIIL